jgi:hypothetical protein
MLEPPSAIPRCTAAIRSSPRDNGSRRTEPPRAWGTRFRRRAPACHSGFRQSRRPPPPPRASSHLRMGQRLSTGRVSRRVHSPLADGLARRRQSSNWRALMPLSRVCIISPSTRLHRGGSRVHCSNPQHMRFRRFEPNAPATFLPVSILMILVRYRPVHAQYTKIHADTNRIHAPS